MKEVVVKFEPFVFKQTIFIKDENGNITKESVPQKELTSYLSHLEESVEAIHLFGNEQYALKVQKECISKYKMNKVNFIINK